MADPVTFVIDVSHHQPLSLDLAQTRRDGCEACLMKAGEGGSMVDPHFASNLAEARNAGQLVGAYWFIRANATPGQHVALMRATVPKDVPIIPDVETASDGSKPTLQHATNVLNAIRAEGWRVPLGYVPLWYWRDVWRSPQLDGWPDLWSSRYPDNVVGTLAAEWADVPAHFWNGYGGRNVGLLQFTSSARIAGYAPLDASAYRGTRNQLAALLGQTSGAGSSFALTSEVEMLERVTVRPPNDKQNVVRVNLSGTDQAAIVVRPKMTDKTPRPLWVAPIYAWGQDNTGVGHDPAQTPGYDPRCKGHRRFPLPGALWADVLYSAKPEDDFVVDCF
ncbi:glycoside hydrolase family 25 protein [Amycolatopsis solani]|uniref:glycoside hydrolase family 25 protein n=1 Tax=Amycolatopsis solani TaxID=3028615 RepID=UPI0025B13D97|nr:GH25 family lysozyme [Amycolatopsis sp. MEP2-6]